MRLDGVGERVRTLAEGRGERKLLDKATLVAAVMLDQERERRGVAWIRGRVIWSVFSVRDELVILPGYGIRICLN